MDKITGIDISKKTLDCSITLGDGKTVHKKVGNNAEGFDKLLSLLPQDSHVVMESSGPYYYQLAYFLHGQGVKVSVINALIIKRFCQMRMSRTKTDKKDASMIREYGIAEPLKLWQPDPKSIIKLKQIISMLDMAEKAINMFSNQLEAFGLMPDGDASCAAELTHTIEQHKETRRKLEKEMKETVMEHYAPAYEALLTIPGIGPKTAVMLIAITGNFTKFKHHKELCAYVGFNPGVFESGTSVKARGRISKMGSAWIRKILYLCTWTARKVNVYCKEMYDRLKAKGKPKLVIGIALANKLLRQAFGVGRTLTTFNNNMKINLEL